MDIAVIGLPSAGKTSLFSLLTGAGAKPGKNGVSEGVAKVPDDRIDYLSAMFRPKKTTYAQMNLLDQPGYSAAAARSMAKSVDALLVVTGVYALAPGGGSASETASSLFDDLITDIILGDLQQVEGTIERLTCSRGKPPSALDMEVLQKARSVLEQGLPARSAELNRDEQGAMHALGLASWKPIVVAVNLSEDQVTSGDYPGKQGLAERCSAMGAQMVEFSCAIEKEVSLLDAADQQSFLSAYGLSEPGVKRLARAAYECAGLISFFTCGEDEVRAWPIKRGLTAREAAGKIHTDIERGFIRAEVFSFSDLKERGSVRAVKEAGRFRLESRDYVVCDGDICSFRFNV